MKQLTLYKNKKTPAVVFNGHTVWRPKHHLKTRKSRGLWSYKAQRKIKAL